MYNVYNKFTRHVSTSDLPIPEAGDIRARKRFKHPLLTSKPGKETFTYIIYNILYIFLVLIILGTRVIGQSIKILQACSSYPFTNLAI